MNRPPIRNRYPTNQTALQWQTYTRAAAAERALPASIWDSAWASLVRGARQARESTIAVCGAFEWIALGYLAVSVILISLFARNLAHPHRLIILQSFVAFVILSLCHFEGAVNAPNTASSAVSQKFWHF